MFAIVLIISISLRLGRCLWRSASKRLFPTVVFRCDTKYLPVINNCKRCDLEDYGDQEFPRGQHSPDSTVIPSALTVTWIKAKTTSEKINCTTIG